MELFVVALFFNEKVSFLSFLPDISFLWMNVIGAVGVVLLSMVTNSFLKSNHNSKHGSN
jgi:hypothetical protein